MTAVDFWKNGSFAECVLQEISSCNGWKTKVGGFNHLNLIQIWTVNRPHCCTHFGNHVQHYFQKGLKIQNTISSPLDIRLKLV